MSAIQLDRMPQLTYDEVKSDGINLPRKLGSMMGRIHKLMIRACLKGIAIGWAFLFLGLALNVMNMRTLIFSSSDTVLAIFLLMVGFAITFGNAAMGHAVMGMARKHIEEDV
jgi:hypothetical protein